MFEPLSNIENIEVRRENLLLLKSKSRGVITVSLSTDEVIVSEEKL